MADIDENVYVLEDDEPETNPEEPQQNGKRKNSLIALFLKIMTTPIEGWKELKRRKASNESIAGSIFYPMVALAALSQFAALFYDEDVTLNVAVTNATIIFVAFFFGYFTMQLVAPVLMPKECRDIVRTDLGKNFMMINTATLALFYVIYSVLPLLEPLMVFLPLWTIYLVFKGVKIFRIAREKEARVQFTLCAIIIGMPVLWYWVIEEFRGIL